MNIDALDTQLLGLVRQNARTPVAVLAKKLGVVRGTVVNRLRKLEDAGVIAGYTVKLRPDAQAGEVRAWMGIRVAGNQTLEVIAHLMGEPGIDSLHDTNGRWDLLAELRVASMAALADTLERIRLLKGIESTETSIHLKTYR